MQLWPHKVGRVPNAHISVITGLLVLIQPSTALLKCTPSIFSTLFAWAKLCLRALNPFRYVPFKHVRDEGCKNSCKNAWQLWRMTSPAARTPPQARRVATSNACVSKKKKGTQEWTGRENSCDLWIPRQNRSNSAEQRPGMFIGNRIRLVWFFSGFVFPCPQRLKNYS